MHSSLNHLSPLILYYYLSEHDKKSGNDGFLDVPSESHSNMGVLHSYKRKYTVVGGKWLYVSWQEAEVHDVVLCDSWYSQEKKTFKIHLSSVSTQTIFLLSKHH